MHVLTLDDREAHVSFHSLTLLRYILQDFTRSRDFHETLHDQTLAILRTSSNLAQTVVRAYDLKHGANFEHELLPANRSV
jgi:hypothetical protein